jgi:uncharacterized phiE125 gp8 family phage protein
MTPRIIVDATDEPLTYEDIIAHARRPPEQEREVIEGFITAARASCESYQNVTISPKTLEIALDEWPFTITAWPTTNTWACVELPLGPVQSIVSVVYVDSDGAEQTLDDSVYVLDNRRRTALLRLAYGASWPSVRSQFEAIKIQYVAGYRWTDSPPELVPATTLQAMRLLVADMIDYRNATDENNLAVIPLGLKYMLDPERRELGV